MLSKKKLLKTKIKYNKKNISYKNSSKKYNYNSKGVTVRFTSYSGEVIYDATPKHSYTYNGVPGGWFI
jgi:hypothetical protein